MKSLKLACIVSAVFLLGAAPQSPDSVVPGVTTEVVKVDVVVTEKGKAVRNLSREDFQLLEDGKPQPLVQFQIMGGPEEQSAPASAPAPAAPGVSSLPLMEVKQQGAAPKRNVLLLVDDLHIAPGNMAFAKEALTRFVKEVAGPEDRIGLVTTSSPGVTENFTQERGPLEVAIGRLHSQERTVPVTNLSGVTEDEAELIERGDPNATRLASQVFLADPIRSHPTSGPKGNAPGITSDPNVQQDAVMPQLHADARRVLEEALSFSDVSLGTLAEIVRGMGSLPGRKVCVLASDGFLMGNGTPNERRPQLQRIVDAAMRSGAVVYSLDTRGIVGSQNAQASVGTTQGAPPGLQDSVASAAAINRVDTLATIADQTGGFLVKGTNDLAGALGRILSDNDYYYILGYTPPSTKRDGRFHKIQVKLISHKGEVRSRKGYFSPDDKKSQNPSTLIAGGGLLLFADPDEAAALKALDTGVVPADLPVTFRAAYVDLPPGGSQVFIQAKVGLGNAHFDQAEGRYKASVELVGRAYDESQQPIGKPFGKKTDFDWTPAQHDQALRDGVNYKLILPLSPGTYELRLVASEGKGGAMGGAQDRVEIPDLGTKHLTLSDVFLFSSDPAKEKEKGKEREQIQVADLGARFKRSSTLYFQAYVYNPLVDANGEKDVVLQAQIRQGTKVVAASKPTPVAFAQTNGVPIPETNGMGLATLEPGDYRLRIVAFDSKARVNVFREITFAVE